MEFGHDMFDLDISPDGLNLSASVTNLNGNQFLYIYELNSFNPFDKENIKYKENDGYLAGEIVNEVEHIVYLNNGHSQQAPRYFIEQVLVTVGVLTPDE